MAAYLTNRNDDCLRGSGALPSRLPRSGRARRRRARRVLARLPPRQHRGDGPGDRLVRPRRSGCWKRAADCVERGYLLVPTVEAAARRGRLGRRLRTATAAAAIGARFQDADLVACALHLQGRALIRKGEVEAGLDAARRGDGRRRRRRALAADDRPDLLQRHPGLPGGLSPSTAPGSGPPRSPGGARPSRRSSPSPAPASCTAPRSCSLRAPGATRSRRPAGPASAFGRGSTRSPRRAAFYQRAEMHRLRGAFAAAEADYRRASGFGCEPQPGLALLRLAQGDAAAAAAAIAPGARRDRRSALPRAAAAGAGRDRARGRRHRGRGPGLPRARAGRGGDRDAACPRRSPRRPAARSCWPEATPAAALRALRRALEVWQASGRRTRPRASGVLIGRACRALADDDGAELEFAAARADLRATSAPTPDLARLDALAAARAPGGPHGLTRRELQVLRLVSAGKTNAAIAAELFLSERTVERHLSNIFTKLDLSTRAAATAWAYEHGLV